MKLKKDQIESILSSLIPHRKRNRPKNWVSYSIPLTSVRVSRLDRKKETYFFAYFQDGEYASNEVRGRDKALRYLKNKDIDLHGIELKDSNHKQGDKQ